MNLLLNYDYSVYPYTTASYIEDAAKQIEGINVLHRSDFILSRPDLIFNIMPFDDLFTLKGVPSCYWEIDCHLCLGQKDYYYNKVDVVYIAQALFITLYPKHKTFVLPLACDPDKHHRIIGEKQIYDVGFIGNDTYGPRRTLLEQIGLKYKVLRTNSPPGLPYSTLLSQCRLTFNRSLDNDVNMRFFEAIAIGRLLLTDYLPQQDRYAAPGIHYQIYKDWPDLDKKIAFYLAYEKEREKIAWEGAVHFKASQTYKERLLRVLRDFGWTKFS